MGCSITDEFDALDFRANVRLVFLILQAESRCHDDGRIPASREWLAKRCDLSPMVVRAALKKLQASKWIKLETKARGYTLITIVRHRQINPENNPEKNPVNDTNYRHESKINNPENNPEKNHTGVTAVSSSLGVVVSPDVENQSRAKTPRATPPGDKFKTTAKARYDDAYARAPGISDVILHFDRLFADLSGSKYPWSGSPGAATVLADLIVSHGSAMVMAAAEQFFQRGDPWIEERAWSINEFSRQFAKFVAMPYVARRRAAIAVELETSTRPTTPTELRANLDAMRRRRLLAVLEPDTPDLVNAP